ncbi:MAG: hypothetical protein JKY18_00655 [Flavobacteriales bacterium]|nr:hypothetical protein [Flavobacteriales bacterium]MBL4733848.1 hypothetical protein [Flavobacteriales bacterium]
MNSFGNILPVLLFALVLCTSVCNAGNWELYTELDGIRIEYKYADCDLERGYDQQWVLLKITNTSVDTKLVEWKSNLWYNGECKTCDVNTGEYHRTVSVDPGKTLEGTCSIYGNESLNVFVKFIDIRYQNDNREVLTKFELDNLSITTSNGR